MLLTAYSQAMYLILFIFLVFIHIFVVTSYLNLILDATPTQRLSGYHGFNVLHSAVAEGETLE